ncbi:MAG: hypothetical protein P8Y53_16705 [Pseudolabrys sp.]|jgi:hypothetical protein
MMCHHIHVTLSAEDKAAARRLTGVMIPVYASILLAVVAVLALSAAGPRPGTLVASAPAAAAQR